MFNKFIQQEISRQAAKTATDVLWSQTDGVSAYNLGGKILIGCGIGWGLLSIIPLICGESFEECGWMYIITVIQIILGTILTILSKKSKKFQTWANKNFKKSLKKKEHLEDKVKTKKGKTLPWTYGDVLACKILIGLAVGFALFMWILTLLGWIEMV